MITNNAESLVEHVLFQFVTGKILSENSYHKIPNDDCAPNINSYDELIETIVRNIEQYRDDVLDVKYVEHPDDTKYNGIPVIDYSLQENEYFEWHDKIFVLINKIFQPMLMHRYITDIEEVYCNLLQYYEIN